MAWVRPKPKKREPINQDPLESFVPLLSFFSGRRPVSPTKPKPFSPKNKQLIPREVSQDPVLRNFHQAQVVVHEERPTTTHSHKSSQRPSQRSHSHHQEPEVVEVVEEEHYERVAQRPRIRYEREPSPSPPPPRVRPPPPRARPKPRVVSYERPMPRSRQVVRERAATHYRPPSSDEEGGGEPYWAVSSRFKRGRGIWD